MTAQLLRKKIYDTRISIFNVACTTPRYMARDKNRPTKIIYELRLGLKMLFFSFYLLFYLFSGRLQLVRINKCENSRRIP
jgi:hypothetical protein